MKCRDCCHRGWGDDEGTPVYGFCIMRGSCPDPDIERSCPDFEHKAVYIATSLRPVSREQVEKVWRGEWVEETYSTKSERNRTIHSKKCICSVCNKSNGRKKENFCPACGTPMTDEAVDMVMERLEALKDGKGD